MLNAKIFLTVALITTLAIAATAQTNSSQLAYAEITGVKSIRLAWVGENRHKPIVVTSADQLRSAMPQIFDQDTVSKKVNFDTHELLIFAWKGNSWERLHARTKGSMIEFYYWTRAQKDLHLHLKLFKVKKGTKWNVVTEPDPR
jgi:hypothetical protein